MTDEVSTGQAVSAWCPHASWGSRSHCHCTPLCAVCGNHKHTAIHGPAAGEKEGGRPYHHAYSPTSPPLDGEAE